MHPKDPLHHRRGMEPCHMIRRCPPVLQLRPQLRGNFMVATGTDRVTVALHLRQATVIGWISRREAEGGRGREVGV